MKIHNINSHRTQFQEHLLMYNRSYTNEMKVIRFILSRKMLSKVTKNNPMIFIITLAVYIMKMLEDSFKNKTNLNILLLFSVLIGTKLKINPKNSVLLILNLEI